MKNSYSFKISSYIALTFVGLIVASNVITAKVNPHLPCDQNIYSDTSGDPVATVNLDVGEIATGVCIKSGRNMFDGNHSPVLGNGIYENGCYLVEGVGTSSVVVTRLGSGNDCQGISHIDVNFNTYSPSPIATPTSTSTATSNPTATPTDMATPTATPTEAAP